MERMIVLVLKNISNISNHYGANTDNIGQGGIYGMMIGYGGMNFPLRNFQMQHLKKYF